MRRQGTTLSFGVASRLASRGLVGFAAVGAPVGG